MMNWNKRVLVVIVFLLLTMALRAYVSVTPRFPARKELTGLPRQIGDWNSIGSSTLNEEISGVLKADDYLLRQYIAPGGTPVDLFIAYYKVQKAGESMHSPKNCLPGSGWRPVVNDTVVLENDQQGKPVRINRYLIEKGDERSLVLYWYQANGRIIASEYWGKFYLVYDALRTGRRDGSMVRIILPLRRMDDPQKSLEQGLAFARVLVPALPEYLPD